MCDVIVIQLFPSSYANDFTHALLGKEEEIIMAASKEHQIAYTVHKWSSYSGAYYPQ